MKSDTEVLIVGAGPTGLVLALWLTRFGVRVRIIDKSSQPGATSRALVVHARTLEFYQQLGLAHTIVAKGIYFAAINLWVNGKLAGRIPFGDIGAGLSPFPFMLIFPQDEHERVLVEELARVGVHVERETELVAFTETGNATTPPGANHNTSASRPVTNETTGVRAQLRSNRDGESCCACQYIAGCDGARSTVREQLHIGFPGGTYDGHFYVADTEGVGSVMNGEMHGTMDSTDFLAFFPMKGAGHARLVGQVRNDGTGNTPRWDDVDKHLMNLVGANIQTVRWFSTYRVHHRVADNFREGRAFLLGDAAHIHSPVGGQGMNTGIGDAVNLAWKLAAVIGNRAPAHLLDSYEIDRIAFARRLVASTDRAFEFISSPGPIAKFARVHIAARLLPVMLRLRGVRTLLFRTVSQTALRYAHSPLSKGKAGRVRGGDRLPWVPSANTGEPRDNFAALALMQWQVHVYGVASDTLRGECTARAVALFEFAFSNVKPNTGLKRNAAYVVRPDGYVGLAEPTGDAAHVARYLDCWTRAVDL